MEKCTLKTHVNDVYLYFKGFFLWEIEKHEIALLVPYLTGGLKNKFLKSWKLRYANIGFTDLTVLERLCTFSRLKVTVALMSMEGFSILSLETLSLFRPLESPSTLKAVLSYLNH